MYTVKMPPMELCLYYGTRIVGKLFLLVGTVFLIGVLCIASEADPEFVKIFGAAAAGAFLTGLMSIVIPFFMKKPDSAKYMPGILEDAKAIQSLGSAVLCFIVISSLPLVAVSFFLLDVRDCLPWCAIPETGIVLSCKETNILVDYKPLYCYQIQVKTSDGREITSESYSVKRYEKSATVPLERSGSLYRLRGSYFGEGASMTFILLGMQFLDVCIFIILAHALWKLGRFVKFAETVPVECWTI